MDQPSFISYIHFFNAHLFMVKIPAKTQPIGILIPRDSPPQIHATHRDARCARYVHDIMTIDLATLLCGRMSCWIHVDFSENVGPMKK